MSVITAPVPGIAPPASMRDRLAAYLSCFWLRPENALWMALRSDALAAHALSGPMLDLSCGDGLFSFLHAGGRLDDAFDAYVSVGHLDRVTTQHADMYDHVDAAYSPTVTRAPAWRVATATDLKASLLTKAARLNFYDELIQADHNRPLPLESDRYHTVYSNSAYWVEQIDVHLAEIRRVAAPDATVLMEIKLDAILDYTFAAHAATLGEPWLRLIGRGRFETWPTMGDETTWRRRFESAGFKVDSIESLATRTHARIWDVGLRPIAPLLVRMTQQLDAANRLSIKRDWIELMLELLEPFARRDVDLFGGAADPAEVLFVLRPA